MKKLQYITVLRALAILAVLVVHTTQTADIQKIPEQLAGLLNNGMRGVQLFYMLSAFTLFLTYTSHSRQELYPKRNFFIRRFFRIAPLYYLAIIYYLWQDGFGPRFWLGDAPGVSNLNILSNFLLLHSFSPRWINSVVPGGWSVGIEFVFYAMFPFIFSRIRNMQDAVNFTLITLAFRSLMLVILVHHPLMHDTRFWIDYLYLYLPDQLPVFSLGFWLYFIIYEKDKLQISGASMLLMSLLAIAGLATQIDKQIDYLIPTTFWWGLAFVALAVGVSKYQPRILFNPLTNYIGTISYTIYLTHFAGIHLLEYFHLTNPLKGQGRIALFGNLAFNYTEILLTSMAISTPLYYSIEKPMQDVGKRLIARMEAARRNRNKLDLAQAGAPGV
jgi:peptidoglycan/LPS O-acetylase OafA/YrhL